MGISIWQLLIVLGIVILLFGTKKLRNIGGDLGNGIGHLIQQPGQFLFLGPVTRCDFGGHDLPRRLIKAEMNSSCLILAS